MANSVLDLLVVVISIDTIIRLFAAGLPRTDINVRHTQKGAFPDAGAGVANQAGTVAD